MLSSQWLRCSHCFTSLVSFTGFYTEDEPKKVEANIYVYLKKGGGDKGGLITSSLTTILRFTSRERNISLLTLLKNRGSKKCQKRYISPIL